MLLTAVLIFGLAACAGATPPPSAATGDAAGVLEAPAARASYALGHQVGSDVARQGRGLDLAALRRGVEDALQGRDAELPEAERNALLVGLKRSIVAADRADRLSGASTLRAQGERFMTEHAKQDGVVLLEGGVQVREIRPGDGVRPDSNDRVRVRYRSTRLDGTPFHDSLRPGAEPETFSVAAVIPGLRVALQQMRAGARWEIVIPPDLAFGRKSALEDQTVTYDLELVDVVVVEGPAPAPAQTVPVAASGEAPSPVKPSPGDDASRAGYAIGYQIGGDFRAGEPSLDVALFVEAAGAALEPGARLRMSTSDLRAALQWLETQRSAKTGSGR